MRVLVSFSLIVALFGIVFFAQTTNAEEPKKITNSIGMKLVLIPAGTFQMGSSMTAEQRNQRYPSVTFAGGAETQHKVTLTKPFYIGVHEVTVGQFRMFVEAESYKTEPERDGKGCHALDWEAIRMVRYSKYTWRKHGFEQDDDHPVVNVTWNDAVAFCKWLSRVEGRDYRLPTEAEWEYSCRAGSSHEFTFGDDTDQLVGFGNFLDASWKTKFPKLVTVNGNDGSIVTSRVGSYRANEFGLHDMHGNVAEWCSDWDGDYPEGPITDPTGPQRGSLRAIRGGGWIDFPAVCRSATRNNLTPDHAFDNLGFRVALSSSGIPKSPEADK